MKLNIGDNYGNWVEPFESFVTVDSRQSCRFCRENLIKKANRWLESSQRKELEKKSRMPKGSKAIRVVMSGGPTGAGYICLNCAKELLENLKREIAK